MKQVLTILALLVLASPALAGSHQPGAHFIENWDMDGDGAVRLDDIMTRRGDFL